MQEFIGYARLFDFICKNIKKSIANSISWRLPIIYLQDVSCVPLVGLMPVYLDIRIPILTWE